MPGTKRTTKSVSYTGHDDDDDFVAKGDNTRKTRNAKSADHQSEPKSSTRKRKEKLSKTEQEELDLVLKLSKETTEASVELPTIANDKESTTSESTVSSHENKTTTDKETDEQDENSLPKSKRIKREEEEEDDDDDGNESHADEEEDEEEEEETELTPETKPIRKTKKNTEIPTVSSIDLNPSRSTTRGQQQTTVSTTDKKAPIGFPTNKIIIPSLQTSRVGLSRKASTIKPLHPNLNQRIVHE